MCYLNQYPFFFSHIFVEEILVNPRFSIDLKEVVLLEFAYGIVLRASRPNRYCSSAQIMCVNRASHGLLPLVITRYGLLTQIFLDI